MQIGQIANLSIIVGSTVYLVAKESSASFKTPYLVVLGALFLFAQFGFNKIFALESIRLVPPTTKDILLVKEFSIDNMGVVLGYVLIASGLLGYVKSFFNDSTSKDHNEEKKE
jgi:hypothetical protein